MMDASPPGGHLWDYVPYLEIETKSDLLLVSAPSYGNVGPAAVRMLIDEAELPLVASIHSDLLPPAAMAWDGVVAGPIQVWGKPMPSGPEGRGGGLLLLNVDIPLPPEAWMTLAHTITDWAKSIEVALVVTLEGRSTGDAARGISAATNVVGEGLSRKLTVELRHTSLAGIAPAFLTHGNRVGLPVLSFFAEAETADADPKAAIEVLRALAPLVPSLRLTSKDLTERAVEVSQRVADQQDRLAREARLLEERTLRSYA